jgi:hypothetical protein
MPPRPEISSAQESVNDVRQPSAHRAEHIAQMAPISSSVCALSTSPAVRENNAETDMERTSSPCDGFIPPGRLPWHMRSECPTCDASCLPSPKGPGPVVLEIQCHACGARQEVHHDAIWTDPAPSPHAHSAVRTYGGRAQQAGDPRPAAHRRDACPECAAVIPGRYYVKHGRVMIEKTCPQHGYYRDCVNSDARLYLRASHWTFEEQPGLTHPHVTAPRIARRIAACAASTSRRRSGQHRSDESVQPHVPVCFASANQAGYVYERISKKSNGNSRRCWIAAHPVHERAVLRRRATHPSEVLRRPPRATEMGMTNIQIATNGLMLADRRSPDRRRMRPAHALPPFDGLDDRIYRGVRGKPLLETKLQVVENCRQVGLKICLVPHHHQQREPRAGPDHLDFAIENADVISGISYQPSASPGASAVRNSREALHARRLGARHR